MSIKEFILEIEKHILLKYGANGKIKVQDLLNLIDIKLDNLPNDKYLFVEDGSVDTNRLYELEDYGKITNTNIIVYRQGSQKPTLMKVPDVD